MAETITADGEIIDSGTLPKAVDAGALSTIVRAEIDAQVTTAKAYPRSITKASNDILELATLDEETAKECIYALPRGGKPVRGASIRLAEIIQTQWPNNRADARVIEIDRVNKKLTAEGYFHDLEKNTAIKKSISRSIADKRGRLFNEDMINITSNAACAIALRNAILAGVPKAVWRKAYDAAEKVIAGDIKTLAVRREAAIKAFAQFGVKPEQIFAALEVAGVDDIGLEHIPTLTGMYSALKNGEETVESMFDPRRASAPFSVVKNPLKDDESVDEQAVKDSTANTPPSSPKSSADSVEKTEPERPVPRPAEGESLERSSPAAAADASREPAAAAFVDPVKAAEERGRADRAKGLSLKAVPPEFRTHDKTALAAAWIKGWNARDKERSDE